MGEQFYCVHQQAGKLHKEYRGTIPPRYSATDTDEDRRDKAELTLDALQELVDKGLGGRFIDLRRALEGVEL